MNITLEQTCYGCPEQYEARDDDGAMVGFLHLRNGFFSVEARRPGEEMVTVYSARPHGDGVFGVDERQRYLDAAMAAIRTHVEPAPADARWESLKAFLDAEVAGLRTEMETETALMRGHLRQQAMLLANVRQHMDEMEAGR